MNSEQMLLKSMTVRQVVSALLTSVKSILLLSMPSLMNFQCTDPSEFFTAKITNIRTIIEVDGFVSALMLVKSCHSWE